MKSFKKTLNNFKKNKNYINILDNTNKIWLASDWHLFHIRSKSGKDPTDILLKNQKAIVKDNDVFIYLGDFVNDEYKDKENLKNILTQLKGKKFLIRGNNDLFNNNFYYNCGFLYVNKTLKWKNYIFSHKPLDKKKFKNTTYNIHGHLHDARTYYDVPYYNHICIYSDEYNYKPITLKEVMKKYKDGFYMADPNSDFHKDYKKSYMESLLS